MLELENSCCCSCYNYIYRHSGSSPSNDDHDLEYAVEVDDSTPSVSSQYQSPYDPGVYLISEKEIQSHSDYLNYALNAIIVDSLDAYIAVGYMQYIIACMVFMIFYYAKCIDLS